MPDYQYKFLYHRLFPGFLFVVGGSIIVAIFVIISAIIENFLLGAIPLIIWLAGTLVLLILFVVYSKRVTARLIADKSKELEKIYAITDFETATQELAKKNLIIGGNLISEEFGPISLDDCYIIFYCKTWSGAFYFQFDFYNQAHEGLIGIEIDKNILTYFANRNERIENRQLFELFIENKEKFLKLLYKYNDFRKMGDNISKVSK